MRLPFTTLLTLTTAIIAREAMTAVWSAVTWCTVAATTRRSRARFKFWLKADYGMRIDTLTGVLLNLFQVQRIAI